MLIARKFACKGTHFVWITQVCDIFYQKNYKKKELPSRVAPLYVRKNGVGVLVFVLVAEQI